MIFMTRFYLRSAFSPKYHISLFELKSFLRLTIMAPFLLVLFSCEENSTQIGGGLLPSGDFVSISSIDTLTARSYSMFDDSTRTDGLSTSYIGSVRDSYFGTTTAEIVTQVRLGNLYSSGDYTIDSVKLNLHILSAGGDASAGSHFLRISEIDDHLYNDTAYYSYTPVNHTSFSMPDIILPEMRTDTINDIELNVPAEFGRHVLRDTTMLFYSNSNPDFRSYFKGIHFQMTGSNDPLLLSLSLASTSTYGSSYNNYFVIYMHDSDGTQASYSLILDAVNENARFNRYIHDFSTADAGRKIQHINDHYYDTLSFIQSFNGVYTRIELPGLADLKKNSAFISHTAINKARLVIPYHVDGINFKNSEMPSVLYMRYRASTGDRYIVPDYSIDNYHSFYDGTPDTTNMVYNFNIAKFVQQYLEASEDIASPAVEIITSSGTQNAILKTGKSKKPLKFEFTYTKF